MNVRQTIEALNTNTSIEELTRMYRKEVRKSVRTAIEIRIGHLVINAPTPLEALLAVPGIGGCYNKEQKEWFANRLVVKDLGSKWEVGFPVAMYQSAKKEQLQRVLHGLVEHFKARHHWVDWSPRGRPIINKVPMKARV